MDEIYSYLDSPSEAIFDDYEELVFCGHPLGRNILGNKKTIKTFNTKMAKAYMQKHYNTDQMILSSVGNISFEKLLRYAEKYIESIPSNKRKYKRLGINQYETRKLRIKKDILQTHCMIGNRAYSTKDPKAITLILLSNLLGGPGMNSRLNLGIREKYGFTYTIESNYSTYFDTGVWSIYFGTEPQSVKKTINLILKELKKLRTKKLGPFNLKRLNNNLSDNLPLLKKTMQLDAI